MVIDNSVMMRWLFKDGSTADQDYAERVLQATKTRQLTVLVPYLWVYESAFVASYYATQNIISYEDTISRLKALFELSTIIRGEESPGQLFDFSQSYGVSSYAASCLLLAKHLDCPLATLDKKMQGACKKLGSLLYEIQGMPD